PARLLELLGDVGDPALGAPTHGAYGGGMLGVGEQNDLGLVRRSEFVAGAEDVLQPRRGVGLPLEVLDRRLGPALLPLVQRRLDQGVSVSEVPVAASLLR